MPVFHKYVGLTSISDNWYSDFRLALTRLSLLAYHGVYQELFVRSGFEQPTGTMIE
ncbi:MAG: hypothetical protein JWM11_6250 [Planctomycetaceae bacterium]|nr:hypothetical protein [Planctomycetaceae bacterium]